MIQFIEEKQKDARKLSMQTSTGKDQKVNNAMASVLSMFEKIGLSRDEILESDKID